ncbi:hypothetical protein FACS1894106_2580 [Spirochaetia bacterium]|nr:hypothetical protein FACS1894106_2580 [Spirochaetia bacterium]
MIIKDTYVNKRAIMTIQRLSNYSIIGIKKGESKEYTLVHLFDGQNLAIQCTYEEHEKAINEFKGWRGIIGLLAFFPRREMGGVK